MIKTKIDRFHSPIAARPFLESTLSTCRYKAIFFDLDGTLVDTVPHICESYQHSYRALNLPVQDDETVMAGIGLPLVDYVRQSVPEQMVDRFLKTYRAYNQGEMFEHTAVFWPAKYLLDQLKQLAVPMGVVTAKGSIPAWENLKNFDLDSYFDVVVAHEDTDAHKPDPTPLYVARDKLSKQLGIALATEDILYVGDARYDVACAKNAGCDAAVVQWTRMPLEPIVEAGDFFVLHSALDLA